MNDEVVITRKIPVKDITGALRADWKDIRKELREILRSYDIPEKYEEKVLDDIRGEIARKLEGLPYKEELCDVLTKLYIRLARILLTGGREVDLDELVERIVREIHPSYNGLLKQTINRERNLIKYALESYFRDDWWIKEETTLSREEINFLDELVRMGFGDDRDDVIRLCVLFAYFKLKDYEGKCPFPPMCDKCKIRMKLMPPHSYEEEEWKGWIAECPKCRATKYAEKIGDGWVG